MINNKEHIIILLVRELLNQYSKCAEDAYWGKKTLKDHSLKYNPFFDKYIKRLSIIRNYDLVSKGFEIEMLYDILKSCSISSETFNNVIFSVISTSIKESLSAKEWSKFSCFEQYLQELNMEIIEDGYNNCVVARGKIDKNPLVNIFNDYTFNDLELKLKASEEILEHMKTASYEGVSVEGACLHTNNFIETLKKQYVKKSK